MNEREYHPEECEECIGFICVMLANESITRLKPVDFNRVIDEVIATARLHRMPDGE
jgi:hypothetical protein